MHLAKLVVPVIEQILHCVRYHLVVLGIQTILIINDLFVQVIEAFFQLGTTRCLHVFPSFAQGGPHRILQLIFPVLILAVLTFLKLLMHRCLDSDVQTLISFSCEPIDHAPELCRPILQLAVKQGLSLCKFDIGDLSRLFLPRLDQV